MKKLKLKELKWIEIMVQSLLLLQEQGFSLVSVLEDFSGHADP